MEGVVHYVTNVSAARQTDSSKIIRFCDVKLLTDTPKVPLPKLGLAP